MKKGYVRELLNNHNEEAVVGSVEKKSTHNEYRGLLQLLAQVADQAAQMEDIYVTFGATKQRDAFILTVIWDGTRTYATGGSLVALSQVAETLLD